MQLRVQAYVDKILFSVFPTPDAQAAQLSNYIRRPFHQATTASGVIQNLELSKLSVQSDREVAGLRLSLSDMRKVFFHIIQPVVHDELFDFALTMAREAAWIQEQFLKKIR